MRSGWTTIASLNFVCSRADGRTLMVYLAPEVGTLDQWHMLAIETTALGAGTQAILDDHAHADQGKIEGLKDAMASAEAFARKWQRRRVAIQECACDELPAPAEAEE